MEGTGGAGGRAWQRGNSKNGRGMSGSRPLQQPSDADIDPMLSQVQKSQIASIVQGARASLHENMRPVTPGDMPRHLFSGDDYQNRPGSSYKMKNVVGQAIDEFNSAIGNTTAASTLTSGSLGSGAGIQMISGNKIKFGAGVGKDTNILNVLQKAEQAQKTRANQLPALDPSNLPKKIKTLNKAQIKGFDSTKPVKVLQTQNSDSYQSQTSLGGTGKDLQVIAEKKGTRKQQSTKDMAGKEDFKDLMTEGSKKEDYEKHKANNLQKMEELQSQIKKANKKRDDDDDEGEYEDEYEDYFEDQMMKDMHGIEEFEQKIDYFEALKKVEAKIQEQQHDPDQMAKYQRVMDDGMDEDYLMQNIEGADDQDQGYAGEYNEVINEISRLCQVITFNSKTEVKEKKIKIEESELIGLCPRIWTLTTEHDKQDQCLQDQCCLETLLKGTFSLLSFKYPRAVLRLSACNVHLFLKIFEKYVYNRDTSQLQDFKKIFNYLFETMRGILIYAKEGQHDILFKQENLIPQLSRVIQVCFLEKAELIVKLSSTLVNKKEILNDDMVYDLVNYTVGSIKCFTQSNVEVQKEAVKQRYIMMLSKCLDKAVSFGQNQTKKSQMLVQICGALRNLSNDEDSNSQICTHKIIPKLVSVLEQYKGHKELMLNISRILSKVSMDSDCMMQIIKTQKLGFLVELISAENQYSMAFIIRIAFVLANLTTYFDESREQVGTKELISKVLNTTLVYLAKDESPESVSSKKEKGTKKDDGNVEDLLVKLVRLIANIFTEERLVSCVLQSLNSKIKDFMSKLLSAIQRKNLSESEEFLLNAISCTTNLLFYDTPSSGIFDDELRAKIFTSLKPMILETQNEEIQIEAVRVLSNLSRHSSICLVFVSDKSFLDTLAAVLDHTLRDLVFYAIGIIINITMHEGPRVKVLDKNVIPKLIDVLRDSNIEDMDLSKVAAKAMHNVVGDSNYWNINHIKKLDEILTSVGEELDSIMDVANEDELQEIMGLRDLVNALINDMPEPMYNCPDQKCGRKFKNQEDLTKHIERRHNQRTQ